MTEIKIIKERQKEIIFSGYYRKYDFETAKGHIELVKGEREDLYFYPDIDYRDETLSVWHTSFHYIRMEHQMLLGGKERIEKDAEWRNRMLGAIRFWVEQDPINQNWWYNQIGMPGAMVNLALAFEDYFTDDLVAGLEKLLKRGVFRAHESIKEIEELKNTTKSLTADAWTGANLVWGAATTIKYALWLEDEALLRIAVNRLAEEIKFSIEGIRADGAFCQHGPRWYSGGYGRSFVYELGPIINILRGTSFALPKEKTDMILLHILEGQRAMMKNGVFDFCAVGREYTRQGALEAGILKDGIALIAEDKGLERKAEISEFYRELTTGEDNYEKTKYYSSIAQLCHKKNGVYFGIRGRTEGVFGAEICNSENILGYNMNYGTVSCIMENGREYFDISPFWDYSKIPGTTARIENDEALLCHGEWWRTLETPCRAFGGDDGESGILSQLAIHDGISVRATFFAFEGTLVALGTDIKDEEAEKGTIVTTVEQCFANNSEIGKDYARNGKLIYKNLDDNTEFCAEVCRKEGRWSRNNLALSDEELYGDIFTVTINRGKQGKYAYLVSIEENTDVKVLRNDRDCQAILTPSGRIMAAFHNDCEIYCGNRIINGKKGEIVLS